MLASFPPVSGAGFGVTTPALLREIVVNVDDGAGAAGSDVPANKPLSDDSSCFRQTS